MTILVNILIVLLVLLQVGDFWTTQRCIQAGGREGNPVLVAFDKWLKREAGVKEQWAWLIIAKVGTVAGIIAVYLQGWLDNPIGMGALVVLVALYAYVVGRNYLLLEKLLMRQYPDGGE